jgi:hypothetical protein
LYQAAAAEKLKNLMEIWAVIRAKPKKKPTTLFLPSPEDMEHQALQAVVLYEWQRFRLQQGIN